MRARVHNSSSHQILVHRAAFALDNGNMPLGLDNETKSQEGSSLALSKRTRAVVNGKPGHSGRGPEVGASTITVPTVDGVDFLWEVAARYGWDEALLDAEGNWRQTYEPLLALKRTQAGELPPPPAPPPPPPPEDDREL